VAGVSATSADIPRDVALRILAELLVLRVDPARLGPLWYMAGCPPEHVIVMERRKVLTERWREAHP